MASLISVGRSTSRLIHVTSRARTRMLLSPSFRSQFLPNLTLRSSNSSSRLLRRELASLLPVHSAIASACLVSKLPSEVSTSAEEVETLRCVGQKLFTRYNPLWQPGRARMCERLEYSPTHVDPKSTLNSVKDFNFSIWSRIILLVTSS